MKINPKILCIPPYISTSWKNVVSLHLEASTLVIGLVNGSTINIPNLEPSTLERVFKAHEKHLELETSGNLPPSGPVPSPIFPPAGNSALMNFPLQIGVDGEFGNILQHNPEASDSPNLPKEMLERVSSLTKAMGIKDEEQLPKPEPHCNCMHCQIMRAIRENSEDDPHEEEEEISEEDLQFREWDIEQIDDKLFSISNPLNKEEQYNVFLGSPVGCTCGHPNCEHIKAVLNS